VSLEKTAVQRRIPEWREFALKALRRALFPNYSCLFLIHARASRALSSFPAPQFWEDEADNFSAGGFALAASPGTEAVNASDLAGEIAPLLGPRQVASNGLWMGGAGR
jgi:hypothetical protein